MHKLILTLLLPIFFMDVAAAGSCNKECRAFSEAEDKHIVVDNCSITCPSDYIPRCYCYLNTARCSCYKPPKPLPPLEDRLEAGYCVKIYHYKWWWFQSNTNWTVCVTTENGPHGECDILHKRIDINNFQDFTQYPMVTDCFDIERIRSMKHDKTELQCGCRIPKK